MFFCDIRFSSLLTEHFWDPEINQTKIIYVSIKQLKLNIKLFDLVKLRN